MITNWLIRRRDAAADAWLRENDRCNRRWVRSEAERRARRRLSFWDTLLDLWTKSGTRR